MLLVVLPLGCSSSVTPLPAGPPERGEWVADVELRTQLFYTREIDTSRRAAGQLALELKADGSARFRVGKTTKSTTRRSMTPMRTPIHGSERLGAPSIPW